MGGGGGGISFGHLVAASRQGGSTLNLQCPVSSRELCKVLGKFRFDVFDVCVFDRALNHNNHNITVKVNAGAYIFSASLKYCTSQHFR